MKARQAVTWSRWQRRWFILFIPVLAAAGLVYFVFFRGRLLTTYRDSFRSGDTSGWRFFGGSWGVTDGVLDDLNGARGDKAVTGNPRWSDYIVETDLRLNADPADALWGDAGIVFRVTDPSVGVDAYDGYYLGIGSEGSVLLLGRANYSWVRLIAEPLRVNVRRGEWFHLRLLAQGCYFEAAAWDMGTGAQTRLTYFDHDCAKRAGAVGVRTFGLPASWRNFSVQPPER